MSNQTVDERIERAGRGAARFEMTGNLVLVVADDGLVLHLSAGWERVFDRPIASMVGNSFDALLADSQVQAVDSEFPPRTPDQHRDSGLGDSSLLHYPDSEAGFKTLEGWTVCVLADSTDRLMIFRDATAKWRAFTTLAENERRFRVVAEASRDMVTETDEKGRFIYVSAACEKVLGYKPEELRGSRALELHHPEEIEAFLEKLREGAKSNEPFSVPPHRLRHRDGSLVWVEATGLVYRNSDGLQRTVGVARDVTPQIEAEVVRRSLEERVLRSQKLESLGVLAGGIAHDFNNLLTPIIGNVGLALLDLPAESPVRRQIEMIRIAANRATALTRQMLAYAGQDVPRVDAVNISSAIEEMALLLEATASRSTKISYDLQNDLPFVEVDSAHIGQVVLNLVSNASECLPETGGQVDIRTGSIDADQTYLDSCFIGDQLEEGLYVYLEVCDDGPGIPEEDRSRIFEPFFTTRFTGRGLGLAAVDGIVRGYGCALELESQIGQGTRIRILFPTAVAASSSLRSSQTRQLSDSGPARETMRGTILVVDDDENSCELMATVLARADFKVIEAAGGAAAIKLFERHLGEIDGVVLDYTMPLVSGAEVFDAIRRLRPDTRVILVSGYAQARAADELSKRGLFGFLQKPFVPEDLVGEVDRLIDESIAEQRM